MRAQIPADTPLATEGCCEVYMDAFDVFLTLGASVERYSSRAAGDPNWQPIPFYPAVYHGRALLFGSYSSLVNPPYDELWPEASRPADTLTLVDPRFSAQFRLEFGRQFAWGLQPMLANYRPEQLEARSREMAFLRQIVRLRAAALKYLRDGTLLRSPVVAGVPAIDVSVRTRSIYTNPAQEMVHTRTVPAVLTSAWRAPDGDVALALVNIADRAVELVISPDRHAWGLGEEARACQLDGGGRRHLLGPAGGSLAVKLGPAEAQVIEWSKE
jgi:hypothetical protein